jgi:parallel beta-helix repeat protein
VSRLDRISRSRTRAAALVACCLGLAVFALAQRSVRNVSAGRSVGAQQATLLRSLAPSGSVDVHYAGPKGKLSGLVRLRATAVSRGARVVAVTFLLDRRPLGSDTSPPYSLDVNVGLLASGVHQLEVTAVDSLGRSAKTVSRPLRTVSHAGTIIRATPGRGVQRALAALRKGRTTVLLGRGRYVLDEVMLGSGARLVGSGLGTVIAAPPGPSRSPVLAVRGRRVRISDLAIDAGGLQGGRPIAVAVMDGSFDVRLQRIRMRHVGGDGVNIWGAHSGVSVQDSQIDGDGNGRAGVVALESGESRDVSVIRTKIRDFRSYGIVFAQKEFGRRTAGLHALALSNEISGIRDPARAPCRAEPLGPGCGTNEAGIESGAVGAVFIGNTIERTAWDGIETVGSSTRTSVIGNTIAKTRTGIYLEHSTNLSLIARNIVSDVRTGINVEWRYGGVGSAQNTFVSNRVVRATRTGLFVDVGANRNTITRNVFVHGLRPAIVLQGSSRNLVRGNRGCGEQGALVREQPGWFDDGSSARPERNQIADNVSDSSCGTS